MIHREDETLLEEEGAGYLISVSDVMAGLLFVFLITLMAFVMSFQRAKARTDEEQVRLEEESERTARERDRLEQESQRTAKERDRLRWIVDDLTNARQLRAEMLVRIRDALERLGIRVDVDTEHGILHLTEQAINFPSGKAQLPQTEEQKLAKIGAVLGRVLPCYAAKLPKPLGCTPRFAGKLESVFIEGHTDNVPYGTGPFRDNWELSAQRAMYTYRTMVVEMEPFLAQLENVDGFPVFGVSGYGDGRPRHHYDVPKPDAANRRIDLRFIMTPPRADVAPVHELRGQGL